MKYLNKIIFFLILVLPIASNRADSSNPPIAEKITGSFENKSDINSPQNDQVSTQKTKSDTNIKAELADIDKAISTNQDTSTPSSDSNIKDSQITSNIQSNNSSTSANPPITPSKPSDSVSQLQSSQTNINQKSTTQQSSSSDSIISTNINSNNSTIDNSPTTPPQQVGSVSQAQLSQTNINQKSTIQQSNSTDIITSPNTNPKNPVILTKPDENSNNSKIITNNIQQPRINTDIDSVRNTPGALPTNNKQNNVNKPSIKLNTTEDNVKNNPEQIDQKKITDTNNNSSDSKIKENNIKNQDPILKSNNKQITTEPISTINQKNKPLEEKQLTQDQIDFINNELIMLESPDGDFVTGELREESKLYRMSFEEYVKVFWANLETPLDKERKDDINKYLTNYEESFITAVKKNEINRIKNDVKQLALDSLERNKIDDFRLIIDKYAILNSKYTEGNNLLHLSIKYDRPIFAKYLLIKGINQFESNSYEISPYEMAEYLQNFDIIRLLLKSRLTKLLYY